MCVDIKKEIIMKKAAAASIVILSVAGVLAGCGKEEVEKAIAPLVADTQATAEAEEVEEAEEETGSVLPEIDTSIPIQAGAKIAVVSKDTSGEFWELLEKGMEQAVKEINTAFGYEKDEQITMTFEGPSDEQDVESQINTMDAVIAENPDVLCIAASDMDSCQAQLESAKENGIPVIAFDSNVSDKKLVRAFRGTDNKQVGRMGAYRLAKAIGKMGKVAVFSAQEKTQSSQERVEGFLDYIAKYSDIEVVQVIYEDQVNNMAAAMQGVLEIYPKLDGVFCTNADVSEMYLDMEKDETRDAIAMVGVDATTRQQEAVKNGEEVGVVSQQPYTMGYQTIWTAALATTPKGTVEIKRRELISPEWIDAAALEDPAYSNYIY